jgi:hypothetical protein
MQKPSREAVIEAYNALVRERGGVPIGAGIFMRETGIPRYCWQAGFWRSWSEFQADAGHAPNEPSQRTPDDVLLKAFADLAHEMSEIPTEADLTLKRKRDPSFPGKTAFRRWGNRGALLAAVAAYCEGKEQFAPNVRVVCALGTPSLKPVTKPRVITSHPISSKANSSRRSWATRLRIHRA